VAEVGRWIDPYTERPGACSGERSAARYANLNVGPGPQVSVEESEKGEVVADPPWRLGPRGPAHCCRLGSLSFRNSVWAKSHFPFCSVIRNELGSELLGLFGCGAPG
jgi:hypothetical protein